MSTTEETPIDNPRFIFAGGGINGDLLLPDGLSCIPREVETANAAAVAAFERYQAAEREYRHAREQARLAPALDASADAAAAAAGKPLPEQRATFASREALQLAARRLEAAKTNARDTQTVLAKSIAKHKPAWISEQDGVADAAAIETRERLAGFAQAYTDLEKERTLATALKKFPVQGSLVGVRMGRINAPRTGVPAAIAELAELIDPPTHRNALRPAGPMSRRVLGQ